MARENRGGNSDKCQVTSGENVSFAPKALLECDMRVVQSRGPPSATQTNFVLPEQRVFRNMTAVISHVFKKIFG